MYFNFFLGANINTVSKVVILEDTVFHREKIKMTHNSTIQP